MKSYVQVKYEGNKCKDDENFNEVNDDPNGCFYSEN